MLVEVNTVCSDRKAVLAVIGRECGFLTTGETRNESGDCVPGEQTFVAELFEGSLLLDKYLCEEPDYF